MTSPPVAYVAHRRARAQRPGRPRQRAALPTPAAGGLDPAVAADLLGRRVSLLCELTSAADVGAVCNRWINPRSCKQLTLIV